MSGITLAGGTPSGTADLGDAGGRALKLQTDAPHLVSMGGDRLSTSVTLHPLPPGRVTLGSGAGVDIPVQGTGVAPLHCHIENSEGVVILYPLSENLSIDGIPVSGPTRLSQGVMLTIGRSNYLRFNHPAEAKLMKSVLPNPRISMAPIKFEPADVNYQSKFNKKPPVVPRKSPRESLSDSGSDDPPSSIMTKVSKFEYLAAQNLKKSYSPKVFTSNVPTVNVPVKDVLGKDIDSLRKSLPQSAVNYVELNTNEKQQNKGAGQAIFTKNLKQPQYVNVTVNETRNINNRVIIYENGCIPKSTQVCFDHNDLNNKTATKNVNVSRINAPNSPSFNRNASQYYRSVTPSPVSNNIKVEHRRSGSVGELPANFIEDLDVLASRKHEAEIRRNQAQRDRIKEQELEKAEKQRLEEILNMCAEYERQSQNQTEKSKPPTPNRIITNGSLPRDKRHLGSSSPFSSPPPSPLEILHNELLKQSNHYDNMSLNHSKPEPTIRQSPYENVEIRHLSPGSNKDTASSYENVTLQSPGSYPSSPRTRIKTFVHASKDNNIKAAEESIDSKFAAIETERKLLKEAEKVLRQNLHNSKEITEENFNFGDLEPRKGTPTKFIYPLDGDGVSRRSFESRKSGERDEESTGVTSTMDSTSFDSSSRSGFLATQSPEIKRKIEQLKKEKKESVTVISRIKRQMGEIEMQEEELHREIELEKALINGEFKSKQLELDKMEAKKQKLMKRAQRIEDSMRDCQMKQEEDQRECKQKLLLAQEHMTKVEERLKATKKATPEYEAAFDEYLHAQEQLDNEKKNFEDLEFHHLEEEADWLASREELQREIADLSHKIENLNSNIRDLDGQKQKTSKTNSNEYKTIEKQKLECMVRLEEIRNRLKCIDNELSLYTSQESDQEVSSESDESDKSKNKSQFEQTVTDLSCSMIVSSQNVNRSPDYNMSQSFNEKWLQEKCVLEDVAKKFPSQDDIDRISKVTSNSPIIGEDRSSLGKKAIESLKEIERNRHLHLCQQGSQVIEQERQRVLALKQRVQEEVKSQWEQQRQDSLRMSSESEGTRSSGTEVDSRPEEPINGNDKSIVSKEDEVENSPRPLSEISDMSVEVGGNFNKKRGKPIGDKQRPLTRYLPIRGSDLDLRHHIETAGHQVVLCPHVTINSSTCRGFLHKKGSKLNGWSRRWFVFDRNKHTFTYYADKSEKKPRGGAYFQAIEEVYLDHLNTVKSPNPNVTFIVKTHERLYYLMAPSPEAMRIWVDVIFTGAEGYREFEHGT